MSENTRRREQILKDITDHLVAHRQVVYGLCESIKAANSTVEMILPHITECDMSTNDDAPRAGKTNGDPGACKTSANPVSFETRVDPGAHKTSVDYLKQSLKNLHSSLFNQSQTLVISLGTLNKHVHDNVLDNIRRTEISNIFSSPRTESSTQTILSCKAMGKGDILDISDSKQEKIEEVVVIRNNLWEKSLKYEEELKQEKELSTAYQTETRQLKEELKELQNKHEKDLQKAVDHHTSDVNKLNARIKSLQDKSQEQGKKSEDVLREMITKYESEAEKMNETIHMLQKKLEEMEDKKKKSDNDLREKIACHESEVNLLTSENHELKDQMNKIREKTLQNSYRGHLVRQVNELLGKNIELKKLLREEKEKNETTTQAKDIKYASDVRQLNEKIAGLEEQLKVEEKERKEERLKHEEQLRDFHRQARKRPVQLSYLGKGDLLAKVLDELKMALVDKLGIKRHELQFVTCLKGSDVDPDIPVLALCINVSGHRTEASTTIQNIKASKNVLLVILHHKDEHALPSQTSDRILTGPEFHKLAGIYDIGFLTDNGIYTCEMNNMAIDGKAEFITKDTKRSTDLRSDQNKTTMDSKLYN